MSLTRLLKLFLFFILLFSCSITQAQSVTEIITNFNGFWKSGVRPNVNAVAPDNSHDLLSFTWNGTRYSTGVADNVLTANGLSFLPSVFKALPVGSLSAAPQSGTYVGLGQLYDGVANGAANPPPPNNIPFYLTDGVNGLNLGTAVYNLPAGNVTYDIASFNTARIGDNIPDILVTQVGEINTSSIDTFKFVDASGNLVGNAIALTFAGADTLGIIDNDFYNANVNPLTFAGGFYPNNTKRAVRMYAFELSQFGFTASDFSRISKFIQRLSGQSDQAFVAYNTSTITVVADNNPGCFSNLPALWLKANNGTSTITNNDKIALWQDKSANAYLLEQSTTTNEPKYKDGTTSFNFNPYLDFDAANKLISINSPITATGANADIFIVGRATSASLNKVMGFSRSGADNSGTGAGDFPAINYDAAGRVTIDSGNVNLITGTGSGLNAPFLSQVRYKQGAGGGITLLRNGAADGSVAVTKSLGSWTFQLGDAAPGDNGSDLDIAEAMVFPQNLTDTERLKLDSYLSIKYGISNAHSYISGANGTVWDMTASPAYNNNIFGIGREDCQGLHQKQSKSQTANGLVTVANIGLATENSTNFNLLANNAFEMMGDNGASLALQATEVPFSCYQRVGREWKVRETNTVGNLFISVPASTSILAVKLPAASNNKMYLLVDDDGDFTSGIINIVPMTLNGTNWEVTYNFTDGNYYTFATDNGISKDMNDLPSPWPAANATINGCNTNADAVIDRNDLNYSRSLVWAGAAVTAETVSNANSTATGDGADDGLVLPGTIQHFQTNTFNVLLNSNIANTTVYYRLWIDWNNDGNFANDTDGSAVPVAATYTGSGVVPAAGALVVPVDVIPPANAVTGFAVRLAVSDAPIANNYAANSNYVYNIANGEVEDYSFPKTVLPVKLSNISASAQDCAASLQWTITAASEAGYFIVEKSDDALNFSQAAIVTATGNLTYKFSEAVGSRFYRLKVVSKTGEITLSDIVNSGIHCNITRVSIGPNPASRQIYITGINAGNVISIIDATGRVVLQKTASAINETIDVSPLANAIYMVTVTGNGKRIAQQKLVKQR